MQTLTHTQDTCTLQNYLLKTMGLILELAKRRERNANLKFAPIYQVFSSLTISSLYANETMEWNGKGQVRNGLLMYKFDVVFI